MPIDPKAKRIQKATAIRLDPDLTARLKDYCNKQLVPPSHTRVIEVALRQLLDRLDKEANEKAA